ncbi:MAG: hypothetical protein WC969_04240 [Elusimicrobiota bacterium]|jgi:hypothetical protein
MELNEIVEQLSFGKSVPKMDSCLGLFLSPEVLYLTEVSCSGKPQVLHLLRIPVPAGPAAKETRTGGSLNTDFLADADRVAGLLKKAMDETKWGSKHVIVTLSHHFGILRYFTLPAIDRRFWKTAIPAEAKKYIPIPFTTLAHDFQSVPLAPGPDKRARLGSLFGVAPRKNMDAILSIVGKLGLTLVGVELAPISVERLWDVLEGGGTPYAQAHFDGGEIRVLVSDGKLPILYREAFLARDATVDEIRKVDLGGCVDFTKKQLGAASPARVRLSGQIADMPAWKAAFEQELGMPMSMQDTPKLLGLKSGQWGGYAAIGGALRHLVNTPLVLDLSGVGRVSDEDRRAAMAIFKLTAIVAGIFLFFGAYRYSIVSMKSSQLAKLRRQVAVLEEFKGRTKEQIEAEIEGMRTKVNSFGSVTARQVPLTRVLQAVAESVPDAVWIANITYANAITMGEKRSPRTFNLSGNAMAASPAAEQDLAFRFADTLRKNPVFVEAFPSIDPAVDKGGASLEDDAAALDPASSEAAQEKRTHFTIQCSNERGR